MIPYFYLMQLIKGIHVSFPWSNNFHELHYLFLQTLVKSLLVSLQVLHTWNNKKSDFEVKDLVQEMLMWQRQGYLDRNIWHNGLFSPHLLPQNSSTCNETEQETHVSQMTPTISDQERDAFENEQLDPVVWVPKLCQHFNIGKLKLLKEVGRKKINKFLDGIKNTIIQYSLRSLLRELKCLYVPSIEPENMTDLPDIISKRQKYLTVNRVTDDDDDDDEAKFEPLIDQLECLAWKWNGSSSSSYEVLTCLATLTLFDFSLERLSFGHILGANEIDKLSKTLRENFEEFKSLQKKRNKQAFVLNIALNNPFKRNKAVQYFMRKFPDKISSKFTTCAIHNFYLSEMHGRVKHTLFRGKEDEKTLKAKQKSLLMHFNSIFSRKLQEDQIEEDSLEVNENVRGLLEDLGLTEYYPQRLSYDEVIKITEDALNDVNKTPSTLPELPWYFMRRLIGLNSNIREKGSAVGKKKVTDGELNEVESDEEISFIYDADVDEEEAEEEEEDTGHGKAQHIGGKKITENVINSVHSTGSYLHYLPVCR